MSKAQATPWRVDDDGMYIVGADGSHVCQLGDYGEIKPWREFKNAKVNGPLLAAAPDLLASLEELVSRREAAIAQYGETGQTNDGSDGRYARARAAIAKAQESP